LLPPKRGSFGADSKLDDSSDWPEGTFNEKSVGEGKEGGIESDDRRREFARRAASELRVSLGVGGSNETQGAEDDFFVG
jgi:hypothetical protein